MLKKDHAFEGYEYRQGQNLYKGYNVGKGGFVWAEPGMYSDVALLDVASLHPHSIKELCLFGPEYTERYVNIMEARIAVKHHDEKKLHDILGDAVQGLPLDTDDDWNTLSKSLKIPINSTYGLTSATFPNRANDPRNINNIVALRGALFMVDILEEAKRCGMHPVHIKTDSIKLADATQEQIDHLTEMGKTYGYTFEHECTYEKMCLVNNAVYIAKLKEGDDGMRPSKNSPWTATGSQFAQPYVFKTLFSHEPLIFSDMCETKSTHVQDGALYLDMNEELSADEHNYQFVGKVGLFTPMVTGAGGGELVILRNGEPDTKVIEPNEYNGNAEAKTVPNIRKRAFAAGTKGYRWMQSEDVQTLNKEDQIDKSYYQNLVNAAVDDISKYGDFEWFSA